MSLDVAALRRDTPATERIVHLMASGSSLMPRPVHNALKEFLDLEAEIGGYEAHAARAGELDGVYRSVARLLNAQPHEIALTENATAGWRSAFYALPLKPGDRVLTCEAEYSANYVAYLHRKKRDGISVEVVANDETGTLDVDALEKAIDGRTALIAITWIPTNGGLVNPAAEVGALAERHGIPYLIDACQAAGQIPIDVKALKCDFLSATGRKFLRGPRGTGFLYVKSSWFDRLEPAMLDHFSAPLSSTQDYAVRPDARRFETWENSYALRAGLGVAADYALSLGLENIRERAWTLADYARGKLEGLPGVTLRDLGSTRCAIVSFSIEGQEKPREVVARLRKDNLMIGASDPGSSKYDAEKRKLGTVFRISPHYYNTTDEIDRFIAAIRPYCLK